MTRLKVHNDHDRAIELLLEPSGHCFEMPAGSEFEVLPKCDARLEIHHQDQAVMIVGSVAKVIHDGEVLASWDDSKPARLGGAEDVRRHLLDHRQQISAKDDGALVFRDLAGKPWVVRVQWREALRLVHVEAPLGFAAPLDREAALAVTISRIHADSAVAGFRILNSAAKDELDLTYWMVLLLDEHGTVAASVLDRAIEVCLDMVVRHADRLGAVARGDADPGV